MTDKEIEKVKKQLNSINSVAMGIVDTVSAVYAYCEDYDWNVLQTDTADKLESLTNKLRVVNESLWELFDV